VLLSRLGDPYKIMIICLAKPITPKIAIIKKIINCMFGEEIIKVPSTCHSIINLIVKGNPENNKSINQIISLIVAEVQAIPLSSTIFLVLVFFCIISTKKNIRVDNQPCIKINKIKP
jgi:hypothetical protein